MRPLLALLLLAAPLVAAPVPKGVKKQSSPDGAWYLVECIGNGKPNDVTKMDRNWAVDGDVMLLGARSQSDRGRNVSVIPFTIPDPAHPTVRKFNTGWSVVEANGDTLRFCYAYDFDVKLSVCEPGPGVAYYVFERVKEEK
jgi:hypothetical protein